MAAKEVPTQLLPDDADDVLKRSLPEALSTLLCLQDEKIELTNELAMRAWESMVFCSDAIHGQVSSMCEDLALLPSRRGIISAFQSLSKSIEEALTERLASATNKPRIYKLAEDLGFSNKELRAFIYILICSDCDEGQLQDGYRLCCRFAGMSRTEFFAFSCAERKHMKQGLMNNDDSYDDSFQTMTVPAPVIKALYGGELSFTEAMAVSSSAVATILALEKSTVFSIVNGIVMLGGIPVDKNDAGELNRGRTDLDNSIDSLSVITHSEQMSVLIGSLSDETLE